MSEFLASLPPVAVCFLVCAAKIVEITIQSLKTCMMVKGQRLKAAGLGFIECIIWGLVISTIIGTLGDNYLLLVFYCFGYATGLFLGSTIENKIALGTSNLQLIANDENTEKIVLPFFYELDVVNRATKFRSNRLSSLPYDFFNLRNLS